MTHFDEVPRRIRWSEIEFSHRLSPEPRPLGSVLRFCSSANAAFKVSVRKDRGKRRQPAAALKASPSAWSGSFSRLHPLVQAECVAIVIFELAKNQG